MKFILCLIISIFYSLSTIAGGPLFRYYAYCKIKTFNSKTEEGYFCFAKQSSILAGLMPFGVVLTTDSNYFHSILFGPHFLKLKFETLPEESNYPNKGICYLFRINKYLEVDSICVTNSISKVGFIKPIESSVNTYLSSNIYVSKENKVTMSAAEYFFQLSDSIEIYKEICSNLDLDTNSKISINLNDVQEIEFLKNPTKFVLDSLEKKRNLLKREINSFISIYKSTIFFHDCLLNEKVYNQSLLFYKKSIRDFEKFDQYYFPQFDSLTLMK